MQAKQRREPDNFRKRTRRRPVAGPFGHRNRRLTLGGLLIGAGALALVGAYSHLRADNAARALKAAPDDITLADLSPPPLAREAYFESLAAAALEREPMLVGLSEDATFRLLALAPNNTAAWNRLVYIDLAIDGRLTRDGLAALYRSYETSPFGTAEMMSWRVDLAGETWSALPDDLRARTLAQIPVIGRLATSWDWRIETCRTERIEAIARAVCATAPGTRNPYYTGK